MALKISEKCFIFSVDVESHNPGKDEDGALWIGDLLNEHGIRGTFFVCGEVVEQRPLIVETLLEQGHEIASHGYSHRGYYRGYNQPYLNELDEEKTREELERSFKCFESIGIQVRGYRAPRFRIRPDQLNIVKEFFEYDSSLRLHGKGAYAITGNVINNSQIIELPISSFRPLPITTGSPILLIGGLMLWRLIEWISCFPTPVVFYCHSFDVVAGGASGHSRLNWLKKSFYYRHCGEKGCKLFEDLLYYLLDMGWIFMTCAKYMDYMKIEDGGSTTYTTP